MTLAPEKTQPAKAARPRPSPAARRAGYLVTIVLNVVLLVVVNNLLVWGWLPFLTDDFSRVLPILNLSIGASIVANAVYLVYDSLWFTGLSELVLLAISFAAGLSLYRVFPFDFSAYEFAWDTVARGILILGLVGVGVGLLAGIVKLVARVAGAAAEATGPPGV